MMEKAYPLCVKVVNKNVQTGWEATPEKIIAKMEWFDRNKSLASKMKADVVGKSKKRKEEEEGGVTDCLGTHAWALRLLTGQGGACRPERCLQLHVHSA